MEIKSLEKTSFGTLFEAFGRNPRKPDKRNKNHK